MQCAENNSSDYKIKAIFTFGSRIIDGTEIHSIWQQITSAVLKENRSGNEARESGLQTHVKACYDDSTLYAIIRIYGHLLRKRDEYLWENDAVEIFIDVDDVPKTDLFDLKGIRTVVAVSGTYVLCLVADIRQIS